MFAARALRQIHYWASIGIAATILVVSVTGILLTLKKDFHALQPPVVTGSRKGLSDLPLSALLKGINTAPGFEGTGWREVDRIDVYPADGIAKVILHTRTELQVDLQTGEVLQIGYRTSDLLESIHDFSFIGSAGKYILSLPTGITLLVMWGTGIYLFVLPFLAHRRKRRAQQMKQR